MHLKRYLMPRYWGLKKKEKKWVVRPSPGPHPLNKCIPLLVLIRDVLKYAQTYNEAKKVIKDGKIIVDKRAIKNHKHPVGLMDVIEIPTIKKTFRVNVNRHGLYIEEIKPEESIRKLCRIQRKKIVKKGITQICLHDGRNILVDKDVYKTGDSVMITLPDQKIIKHFKMEKGEKGKIISGKNIGISGTIKAVYKRKSMLEKSRIILEAAKKNIETSRDYVLVGEI